MQPADEIVSTSEFPHSSVVVSSAQRAMFGPVTRLTNRRKRDFKLALRVANLSLNVREHLWYHPLGEHLRLLRCLPSLRHLCLRPPPFTQGYPAGLPIESLRLEFNEFDLGEDASPRLKIASEYLHLLVLRRLEAEKITFILESNLKP